MNAPIIAKTEEMQGVSGPDSVLIELRSGHVVEIGDEGLVVFRNRNDFADGNVMQGVQFCASSAEKKSKLLYHCGALVSALADVTGYMRAMNTDRRIERDGETYALQTLEYAEGAGEYCDRAEKLLEAHEEFLTQLHPPDGSDDLMWQPIETIPRDGTPVLVWGELMSQPDIAWHEASGGALRTYTHWMRLPEPPNAQGEARLPEGNHD